MEFMNINLNKNVFARGKNGAGVIVSGLNHVAHMMANDIGKRTLTKSLMKKIWKAYPKLEDYPTAKELYNDLIGGGLKDAYNESITNTDPKDDHSWENTCAARMSRALNYAGIAVPESIYGETKKGSDGMNYLFRVSDLKNF